MDYRYRYYSGDREKVINILREYFLEEPYTQLAIVFGSFVEDKVYRDIDIAIYSLCEDDLEYLLRMGSTLEIMLEKPVDIVPIRSVNPRFRLRILNRGYVVVDKNPGLYESLLNMTLDELMWLQIYR